MLKHLCYLLDKFLFGWQLKKNYKKTWHFIAWLTEILRAYRYRGDNHGYLLVCMVTFTCFWLLMVIMGTYKCVWIFVGTFADLNWFLECRCRRVEFRVASFYYASIINLEILLRLDHKPAPLYFTWTQGPHENPLSSLVSPWKPPSIFSLSLRIYQSSRVSSNLIYLLLLTSSK